MSNLESQTLNEQGLSESALLVQSALQQRGIETPMRLNDIPNEEKKEAIKRKGSILKNRTQWCDFYKVYF